MLTLVNWQGFDGFRLNDEKYSSSPEKSEYILCEGFRVHIIKINELEVPVIDEKPI